MSRVDLDDLREVSNGPVGIMFERVGEAAKEIGTVVLGVELNGCSKIGDGAVVVALLPVDETPSSIGLDKSAAAYTYRLCLIGDGAVIVALCLVRVGSVVVGPRVTGIAANNISARPHLKVAILILDAVLLRIRTRMGC